MKSSWESLIELNTKLINNQNDLDLQSSHSSTTSFTNHTQHTSKNDNNNHNSNKTSKENEHFTQNLNKYFNFQNAKLIALILVSFYIFYHGYLNSFYGKFFYFKK